jgi:pimeloyl-ACP methyl ester carboxylesterase
VNILLVHGAFHGPWCWDRLTPVLERLGHAVVAVDLPISDTSACASEYADTAVHSFAPEWDEPPVVVAHSLAGLVAPIVASRRPVARLIFLAAILPIPGMSADAQRASEPWATYRPTTLEYTDLGEDTLSVGPNTATELFFHDVAPDVAAWAVEHLRPQCTRILEEVTPLEAWPSVPASYIVCRDDRAVDADWGRAAARERLGVEAVELGGGHSPFLSRPVELGQVIDALIRAGNPFRARDMDGVRVLADE